MIALEERRPGGWSKNCSQFQLDFLNFSFDIHGSVGLGV